MRGREIGHGYRVVLLFLVATGFALRLPLLDTFPFREDEAIYGFWARHGWQVDPLFLQVWPDKPPLFIWLLALVFQGLEATAPVARLLNIFISTLTIPVVATTARRWWGDVAGGVTGALMAASPFAISFAPTAFTDPLLVLAGALALCLAARRRWFWSGLWLGVAVMTKQQGLLFIPLVLAGGLASLHPSLTQRRSNAEKSSVRHPWVRPTCAILPFVGGLLVVTLPILVWDSLRWAVAPSPWDLGARNVGMVTLAPPSAWGRRLWGWGELAGYLMGSWLGWLAWAGVIAVAMGSRISDRRRNGVPTRGSTPPDPAPAAPAAASWLQSAPWLVGLWGVFFLLFHVVTSVQRWDRYLLPLVLPLALLGGWAAGVVVEVSAPHLRRRQTRLALGLATAGLLGVILATPAIRAARGEFPIGGDHGAYAGLDEALAYVRAASETGPVALYHRELGWHARFYLFDAIQAGDVDLRYYPHAVYLADSATKLPHKRRLVVVPDWAPLRELPWQARNRGLTAQVRLRTGNFTVLELEEVTTGEARWRLCRPSAQAPAPWSALTGMRGGDMMCRQ